MRRTRISILLFIIGFGAGAQNVGIGADAFTPDPSAGLEIQYTDKGMLIPRVGLGSKFDSGTIPSPATSLLVYNTGTGGLSPAGFYYNAGTPASPEWVLFASTDNLNESVWKLDGNSGTTSGTDFLGTTDSQDLDIRTNNLVHFRFTTKGQIEVLNTGNSVFIGDGAGENDDGTGNQNILIGDSALFASDTTENNIAIGYRTLRSNDFGINNIAFGTEALFSNTHTSNNIAIGYHALYMHGDTDFPFLPEDMPPNYIENTANIALGSFAMADMEDGQGNIGIGFAALEEGSGADNIAIGSSSMLLGGGATNIAIGISSMREGGGAENIAIGFGAMMYGSGENNIALGSNSLNNTDHGKMNIAIGYKSLYENKDSHCNIAIGNYALYNHDYSDIFNHSFHNIAIGDSALFNNKPTTDSTGGNNIAIGYNSQNSNVDCNDNISLGYNSTKNNKFGNRNVSIGSNALQGNTFTSDNIAIGVNAMLNHAENDFWMPPFIEESSKNIAIGNNALSFEGGYIYNGFDNKNNTVVGHDAMRYTATGQRNVVVGNFAMMNSSMSLDCIAIGYESMQENFGFSNIGIGSHSLRYNVTGADNIAIGVDALRTNEYSSGNIAIGNRALSIQNYGSSMNNGYTFNIAIGGGALYNNNPNALTNGLKNIAIGFASMHSNTTGYSSVAIGSASLFNNTTQDNLVAIGDSSLFNNGLGASASYEAIENTAVGSKSMYSNTIGYSNTALGFHALYGNTTGVGNFAGGANALYSNQTGGQNIALGEESLYNNNSGYNNFSSGFQALYLNISGYSNSAIGYQAMYSNSIGYQNVAIGENALHDANSNGNVAIGYNNMSSNLSANYNTSIGYYAMNNIETGIFNTAVGGYSLSGLVNASYNTALGYSAGSSLNDATTLSLYLGCDADATTNITAFDYSTAVGHSTRISASRQVRIGNAVSNPATSIGGPVAWTTVSDGRFKDNVQENVAGLDFVMKLRPVTYNFDNEKLNDYINTPDSCRDRESSARDHQFLHTGFIAQEVEAAAKECGFEFSGVDAPKNEYDYYGLRYAEFVVPLVKATQEQQVIIDGLKQENEQLKKQNEEILMRLSELEKKMDE